MSTDAKKLAVIIAGGMPPPGRLKRGGSDGGDDSEPHDEPDGDEAAGVAAMADMRQALDKGDDKAAWSALCDAVRICQSSDYGEHDSGD